MQESFQKQKRSSKVIFSPTKQPSDFMSRNAKAWKFKRALLQNEETYRAKYL